MKPTVNIIYDYFHPAYKAGGPIQSLVNLADHLQDQLDIQVICSNTDHDKTILPVKTNEWVNNKNRKIFYNTAGFGNILHYADYKSVAFINGMYSLNYNFLPALKLKNRKIVSVRGMLHPGALSQKSFKKKVYLYLWKMLGLHNKCEFHATSEQEKEYIQQVFGKNVKVWVVQNLPVVIEYQPMPDKEPGELHLTTIALISPMKNHLQVLKALGQCSEKIIYHIYGPVKDARYWSQCESAIIQLPKNISVKFHGDVSPEKVADILKQVHVYIQPSKSENFGHSLYEALTSGRPIITSHHTPWNNLKELNAGINVDPQNTVEIAEAISQFARMNSTELAGWSKSAREYSQQAIDVQSIRQQYLQMFMNKAGLN